MLVEYGLRERKTWYMRQLDSFKTSLLRRTHTNFSILEHISHMIIMEQNDELVAIPEDDEVKKAVFRLNVDNTWYPNDFTEKFFQHCGEIVDKDMIRKVHALFCGHELPRYINTTNLILLSKRKEVNTFSDMRPIILSNFINKVFSRVVHEMMVRIFLEIISPNQAGFI